MDYSRIAKTLSESLGLPHPPIGLAFVNEAPAGVEHYSKAVPSACAFWKAAQSSMFYATAEDHYNCPIGAITQGFHPPRQVMQQGMQLIEQMGKIQYFEAAEAENVPIVEKPHQVIIYGPLKDFQEVAPDLALLVSTPFQAMLLSEAAGAIAWRGAGREAHIFGRPACAVIPSALKDSAASASLGCMGARTFAGIDENELLVAIPAARLPEAGQKLSVILSANSEMRKFYRGHQSQFAPV
ncbi:MAG TPA: DUF169 domain-containing protein [Terriglobia bacterium]|nr:DUF169 domain-containing protein [Terriglobia bacterium]